MLVQLSRSSRDVCCLVGDSLKVGGKFHRGNHPAQIGRYRLEPQQNIHAILIDLFLELIDLFIIGDRVCAKLIIALEQTFHRSIEAPLRQAAHHKHVVAQ
jgi:hypothetical protein